MENIVKYLLYVFIPILVIFAMSHNASAITSEAVKFYGSGQSSFSMETNTSGLSCVSNCVWAQNTNSDVVVGVNYLSVALPNGTYQSDTIFKLDFILWRVGSSVSDHTVINNLKLTTPAQPFAIYDIQFEQLNANTSMFSIYIKATQDNLVINNYSVRFYSGLTGSFIFALNPTERVSGGNWSHWAVVNTTVDTQSIVNAINSQTDYTSNLNQINNNINNVNNGISDINDHNDKEEQAVEDIENQSTDDVDVGDQSGMTNAVGVVSGIFNQIGSVQATDCKFNANFGHLNLGELNFCTGKENFPFIINFVSSIFTLIVVVGTILILVKQILGLYDWARSD